MSATLRTSWQRTVRSAPAAIALRDAVTARSWTRAELTALGAEWAAEYGGELAGQRVVFSEPNGAEWFRVFLGLLAADAVIVPLDPGEPVTAKRAIAGNIGAMFLWHDHFLEPMGPPRRTHPHGPRLLKLTSGSTGVPQALPFTDAQLLADGRQVCTTMGIKRNDLNLGCIPFGHSYGLGNLVLPLLTQGTAIVCGVPLLPQALGEAIAQWRPTVFPAVPALLRALAGAEIAPVQLRSLRTVVSAGAPLAPDVAQAFHAKFGQTIHNFYGSSETGGITYDRSGRAALTGASVGRPMKGVKLRFGAKGRFWVKSRAVGRRGVFRPADRGELNSKGELVLLGRAGRMVKIAGRRLDPAEVERTLREMPGVQDVIVASHRDRADTLVAAVATRHTGEALREWLQGRIAGWKIPRKFVVVAEFPLTARGKVDSRRLQALLHGV